MFCIKFLNTTISITLAMLIIVGCTGNKNYYKGTNPNRITLIKSDTVYQFNILPADAHSVIKFSDDMYYCYFTGNNIVTSRSDNSGKVLNGEYLELYPNRRLKVKGKYKKGVKDGQWRTWFVNGEMESLAMWSNGKKEGTFFEYNTEGKVVKSGVYKSDMLEGEFSALLPDGREHKQVYKQGKILLDTILLKKTP